MRTVYDNGYRQALVAVGLEKLANPVARWLAQKVPGFLHSFRLQTFGQPVKAWEQLRAGTLTKPGGLVHTGFQAPGNVNKMLLWGIPAGMGAYTMAGDDPDKYEQIGGLAASTLAGNAMFGPLGMLGAMAVMPAAHTIGRHAGGAVRHLATGAPSQASEPAAPPAQYQAARPAASPGQQTNGLLSRNGSGY